MPLPGETLMATGVARSPGGKGLNQAVVATRAGAVVHFCAPLGTEPESAMIRKALAAENFAAVMLLDVGQPTDLSTILVSPDGENCIVSTGACADALTPAAARSFVAAMHDDDLLLLQGNLSLATTLAAAQGRRVVFNTAPLRWPVAKVARLCWIIVANAVEASQITGCDDPRDAAPRLGGAIGVVTDGGRGCVVADEAGVTVYPAPPIGQVLDTTGAGDSFCGGLVAALALGLPIEAAIARAQLAAALAVSRAGCFTALATREELARL